MPAILFRLISQNKYVEVAYFQGFQAFLCFIISQKYMVYTLTVVHSVGLCTFFVFLEVFIMENKENVTKDMQDLPYITMKRLDCLVQQSKTGEEYYMFSGIIRQNDRSTIVTFYTKDKDLYAQILAIPVNKEFKLYYELYLDYQNNWRVKPITSSL